MNKLFKKVLSVLLCVIMLWGTASAAFAAGEITYNAKYFQKTTTNAQNAKIVLDKIDEVLKDADLNSALKDYQSVLDLIKRFGISVDLNSVNGICKTIDSVVKIKGLLAVLGDLEDLNFDVWKTGMKRPDDVTILNELIELLGTSEPKKKLIGKADKINSEIIAGLLDGTTDAGLLDSTVKNLISDKLGKDGVSGLVKELLAGLVYENKNSAEFNNAKAKKLDDLIYTDIFSLFNKDDGALPGFTMNGSSTVDSILLSLFNSAWNKYIVNLIKGIDVDLSTSENEALRKLGEVINLKGNEFDESTVSIDLSKSFESQINDILGSVVKFFFPKATWTNGGKDKLAGNFTKLYNDLAKEFGVEANPLAITKYVLSNLEVEGIDEYLGDYTKWTSMKMAVAAVLNNVAKKNNIPVKNSTDYETILGDIVVYYIEDYIDIGYKAGAGNSIWKVINDIANVFLIDKGFAAALNIPVTKADSIFVKIDKIIDMTKTKFANYNSEEFIKGIIDAIFDFDFATAIDKTVVTFLNDYSNEKAVNVLYDAVYNTLKSCFGKDIIVARATDTPFDNAISNASLKKTIVNLLTSINTKKGSLLSCVLYIGALAIGLGTKLNDAVTIDNQTYTGKAIVPQTIKFRGETLKINTDYTATAEKNIEVGTAAATIKLNGNYKGTITANFNIVLGKPNNLKATSGKTDSASLTWTAVPGAQKYEVTCNGKKQTVTTNKATVSGLTAGKQYTATVKAIRNSSSSSASVNFVTNPAQVTSLKTATAATSAKLTFAKVANATSYEAQYSTDSKTWSKAVTSKTNSISLTGLKANTSYKFRVRAVTKASAATAYGAYSSVITAKTLLSTVTGVKTSSITDTSIKVTWTKVSGAAGYTVQYSTDGKTWKSKNVTTNSVTLKSLKANTTTQIKVRAYDKSKAAGAYSSVVKAATKIAKVTGIKVSSIKSKSFKVTWKKVSGADRYVVEYSKNGKTWTKKTVKTNSIQLTKLSANTTYKIRVTAYKGKTAAPVSSVVKASTALSAPTGVKATKTTKSTVTLKWKKVSGAAGYEIYRNGKKVGTTKKGSAVTFTDKKLSKSKTYKYTVKAYKVVSKKNVLGDVSSTVSVKTKSK